MSGLWYICIILLSSVDGSKIGEVHSPYSMSAEECITAVTMEVSRSQSGIVLMYECHKSEDVSA